jgi:hypothetical protein
VIVAGSLSFLFPSSPFGERTSATPISSHSRPSHVCSFAADKVLERRPKAFSFSSLSPSPRATAPGQQIPVHILPLISLNHGQGGRSTEGRPATTA